jgi:hypothetical protein
MPRQYEAIRDRLIREGKSEKEAKRRAARIYNARHPDNPVGPHYDRRQKRRPGLEDA